MTLSTSEKTRLQTKYGPWAVITGASSGIGRELTIQLAESGLNVVINARRRDELESFAQLLTTTYGVDVRPVVSDMGQAEGIQTLLDVTANLNIGLLVASAGFGTSGLFVNTNVTDEANMVRVNCEAVAILTHHFSRRFSENKRGGIILFSSLVAFQGVPFSANYAATKAYIQSLAEALAVELKPVGVDVLAAAPGPVATGFGQRANMQMNMSLTPQQVGIPILRALGRQTTVLPGFLTKVLIYSLRTVPRWAKVQIMKQVMGGMTQHQRA